MVFAEVKNIVFKNKQNIPWDDVESFLKGFIGEEITVKAYGDIIRVPGDFPDEFTESRYTKKLRGALAKLAEEIETTKVYVNRVIKKNDSVVNNTFVRMMEALGYDIELHYVKRDESE